MFRMLDAGNRRTQKILQRTTFYYARYLRYISTQQDFNQCSQAYEADEQIKEVLKLLEGVVTIWAEALAKDRLGRLASQHELAGAYQANEQVPKVVEPMDHVFMAEARVFRDDHPSQIVHPFRYMFPGIHVTVDTVVAVLRRFCYISRPGAIVAPL